MKSVAKLLVFTLIAALTLTFTGCSKNDIPDPPKAKGELILDIFDAINQDNYTGINKKLDRLSVIAKKDVALATVEYNIHVVEGIKRIQKYISEGNFTEADKVLKQLISKNGMTQELETNKKKLETLSKIQELIKKINDSKNSQTIAIAAGELRKITQTYKETTALNLFIERALQKVRENMELEDILSQSELKADYDILTITDPNLSETLIAEIAVDDPDATAVTSYEASLSDNWNKLSSPSKEINEEAVFRSALTLKNKKSRDAILNKLLISPPNSYSSITMKASAMYLLGYTKESEALVHNVTEELGLSAKRSNAILTFSPNSPNTINLINPLVLTPFLMYFLNN